MNEQKSLFLEIAEANHRHLQHRGVQQDMAPLQRGRLRRFLRWLTPNGGTLLLVAVLALTQRVWAR
jgi:hypothetical protein